MTLRCGTSFYFNNRIGDNHLYFVISDPADPCVVVVNITTIRGFRFEDLSCVLDVGDGTGIQHPSRIAYEYAEMVHTADLIAALNSGDATFVQYVSPSTMAKIWCGAEVTAQLSLRHSKTLRDQGLIA